MDFLKALAEGIRKANDAERIQKEIANILAEFNLACSEFTSKNISPFRIRADSVISDCPVIIEVKAFSWPMLMTWEGKVVEVVGIDDFVSTLRGAASTATFGDYLRRSMK